MAHGAHAENEAGGAGQRRYTLAPRRLMHTCGASQRGGGEELDRERGAVFDPRGGRVVLPPLLEKPETRLLGPLPVLPLALPDMCDTSRWVRSRELTRVHARRELPSGARGLHADAAASRRNQSTAAAVALADRPGRPSKRTTHASQRRIVT